MGIPFILHKDYNCSVAFMTFKGKGPLGFVGHGSCLPLQVIFYCSSPQFLNSRHAEIRWSSLQVLQHLVPPVSGPLHRQFPLLVLFSPTLPIPTTKHKPGNAHSSFSSGSNDTSSEDFPCLHPTPRLGKSSSHSILSF